MLKQLEYDVLYNAKGLDATLDELHDINYFHTYITARPDNYGVLLDALMRTTLRLLREIAPTATIWRMLALYFDIHNMKLAAKERYWGMNYDDLALKCGSHSFSTIRSAAVRPTDDILKNKVLTKGLYDALYARSSAVDFILDKTYFSVLRAYAEQLAVPAIVEFVGEKIDLYNISVFFQMLATDAPIDYFYAAFSEEGSSSLDDWIAHIGAARRGQRQVNQFPLIEKYQFIRDGMNDQDELFSLLDVRIDNYLIGKTKTAKLMAFGLEPICAYFFNKLMEIKNVRILLTGKENGYDIDEIKKRMRIPYEL